MAGEISYDDVQEYHNLFTMAPAFIMELTANTNSNLVSKFKSIVQSYMDNLTEEQKDKLDTILTSDIDDLQKIMAEAYRKTGKKQYNILADPKHKSFIEKNFAELRKMFY